MNPQPCIFVVDEDPATVDLAGRLAAALKVDFQHQPTAERFLSNYDQMVPGCVVCELQLDDMSGVELQRRLAAESCHLPLIFVTTRPEIPLVIRAMRGGAAVTVLEKPLDDRTLGTALREALARDAETRRIDAAHDSSRRRFSGLSTLDRRVMRFMLAGKSNSGIAAALAVEVATVETCVRRVHRKTGTSSLLELARLAFQAKLEPEDG